MGDRTYMQITIYDYPDDKRDEVLALLDEYNFANEELDSNGEALHKPLQTPQFVVEEALLGTIVTEMGPRLIELGVAFDGTEDSYQPWLGQGLAHAPGVGTFEYDADCEGHVLFTSERINELLAMSEEERDKAMGKPVFEALEALTKRTAAEQAFQSLVDDESKRLLRRVFEILEYDDEGQPGSEWSSDTLQALGEEFGRFGITFTDPSGPEAGVSS